MFLRFCLMINFKVRALHNHLSHRVFGDCQLPTYLGYDKGYERMFKSKKLCTFNCTPNKKAYLEVSMYIRS